MSALKTLTDEECAKVMIELDTRISRGSKRKAHLRNRLVVLLMLDAGFRLNEVAKTKRVSLIFAGQFVDTICVTAQAAKGNSDRQIPTTARLKETLHLMQREVWEPDECGQDDFAIYGAIKFASMSPRHLQRIIGHITEIAIGRRINPHMLRHTFATRLMRRTNIRVVQELLGHKSLTSTQIYTHPNGQDLKSAIEALS